jgi:F-type H+-transporting ATPase subunit a
MPYLCANFREGMASKSIKSLLTAVLSLFLTVFSANVLAQPHPAPHGEHDGTEKKKAFDANEVIFDHVLDAHEFHFMTLKGKDGHEKHVSIYLPVMLWSSTKGFSFFMSSKLAHGETYEGYKLSGRKIVSEDANEKIFDFSLTRNVVQMILALLILVWILITVAKRYKSGQGVTSAPKGIQNVIEPMVAFVRDDVAIPNLGHKYKKYLPYLLTVFFFILINNIVGLIPGTANVTGNIAFTMVLGLVSLVVILFSSNKHYWAHIFNPPVPGAMKPIIALVEFLGAVFTKPASLIIRLFANMLAGHIIIICLISLIFIFASISKVAGWGFSPISVAFAVFIYLIEILVAFIQAFIFTTLTAVFIGQAFEGDHAHGDDHAAAH